MTSFRLVTKQAIISLIEPRTTLRELKQIHTQLLVHDVLNDPFLVSQFVAAISLQNPTNIEYSQQVLEQCRSPTIFAYNSIVRAYCKSRSPQRGFKFYRKIQSSENLSPDNYTFTFLVRSCAQLLARESALLVHADLLKHGFENDRHVESGLINMYAELGLLESCRRVYAGIAEPDVVCRTAMLGACAKAGDLFFARKLFDEMPQKDSFAWNAMITVYVRCGQPREALQLFRTMQMEGVEVSEVSMVSVLSACSHLGALDQGRWAHAYIGRSKFEITMPLGTALIDMYAKCGDIDKAMDVFWGMKEKNVCTWSSAMNGLAMNGAGEQCLELFTFMKQGGILPNEITFISVLMSCSMLGLVEEGLRQFDSMIRIYGLEPLPEHYGSMVDLYGRSGLLNEALNFINAMPVKPHTGAWGALLNACKIYNNVEMGELASKKILELEGSNHAACVLMSNIYAESKCWDGVANERHRIKAKCLEKLPGCSVIEVDGDVHEFIVGEELTQGVDGVAVKK